MILLRILVAFLHLELLGLAAALTEAYQIPPWDFVLTCATVNKTSDFNLFTEVTKQHSSLNEDHEVTEDRFDSSPSPTYLPQLSVPGTDFLSCLWNDTTINGSVHTDGTERKRVSLSTHALIYEQHDLRWTVCCWTTGNLKMIVCSLKSSYENSSMNTGYRINFFYILSNASIENSSTTQKSSFKSALCHCSGYEFCECSVPSVELSSHYIMWVEITHGVAHLQSPLLSVTPLNIVKPNPPFNLQMEMTDNGELKLCWSYPKPIPYELHYEVKHSASLTENIWQVLETVRETSMIIGTIHHGSSHVVQVRCKRLHGPGFWSDWSSPLDLTSQEVMYFPQKILTSVGSNFSLYCIYNKKNISSKHFVWWLNLAEKIPEQQYTAINDNIGKVTLLNLKATTAKGKFPFDALYCCHNDECHQRYAEIYVIDVNITISCETDGKLTKMTCRWATDKIMLLGESASQLKYYRSSIYCTGEESTQHTSDSKDCWLRSDNVYECTFQPIFLLSGYTMWIQIDHHLGSLESSPACVMPMDLVKPMPPSTVHAEIAVDVGLLNVSWRRPSLPVYDLRFQIQYSVDGTETIWTTSDILESESAAVEVPDLCAAYIVQVRCRRLNGSGYWSDWSNPAFSNVKDIQAPLKGPEFWRVIQEDPINKQTNVTLLWQPLTKNYSLCNVRGYTVEHQTSSNATWSEYIGNETKYTFSWTDPVHTVTVVAMNSIGSSLRNLNLTFSQQMSAVSIVHSLRVYLINNSCVALFWTIILTPNNPKSFVIEWENLAQEETTEWIYVPSNIDRYYIYDHFLAIEKYRFSLYPVLHGGIGKPKTTDRFSKDENQIQNDIGLYVILPIIVLSSFLLVVALLISHHRMKKMFWEDVPNPKNCSWAQEVNFQKPETLEHLFIKHHETLAFEPPLLLEPEIHFENACVNKELNIENKVGLLVDHSLCEKNDDTDQDSACASIDKSYQESTSESIKYAIIVNNSQSSGLYNNRKSVSSDSTNVCLYGTNSQDKELSPSNFWEVESQTLLILAGLNPSQHGKTSTHSTVSSEGFSEPSDTDDNFLEGASPERDCYYLGMTSTEHNTDFFPEDSTVLYPFQTHGPYKEIGFLQDTSSGLNPFTENTCHVGTLAKKTFMAYMPQFQTNSTKSQETIEKEAYDIET